MKLFLTIPHHKVLLQTKEREITFSLVIIVYDIVILWCLYVGFYLSNLSYVPGIGDKNLSNQTKVITLVSKQYIDGRQLPPDQHCTYFFNKLIQVISLFHYLNTTILVSATSFSSEKYSSMSCN